MELIPLPPLHYPTTQTSTLMLLDMRVEATGVVGVDVFINAGGGIGGVEVIWRRRADDGDEGGGLDPVTLAMLPNPVDADADAIGHEAVEVAGVVDVTIIVGTEGGIGGVKVRGGRAMVMRGEGTIPPHATTTALPNPTMAATPPRSTSTLPSR